MAIQPEPNVPVFELPDPGECVDYDDNPLVLGDGHELRITFRLWKDRVVVEFAVVQVVRHDGQWVEVARIDTEHGQIHKHQLRKIRPDDKVGHRTVLEPVPEQNGWTVIDGWYKRALDQMRDEWKDNLRRWRRGSA